MDLNKGIIAVGAHPDDIELGCGASLAKLVNSGFDIYAIVVSKGEAGNPFKLDRSDEACVALRSLGVKEVYSLSFEDTKLPTKLCEIIDSLCHLYKIISKSINAKRVYTMCENDRHQDHRAIYDASLIAFRDVPQILCYETPSAWANFHPNIFEKLDEVHLIKKIEALKNHKSQSHRQYMQENQIRSVAMFRGQQAGYNFSEGFIPYKMVL